MTQPSVPITVKTKTSPVQQSAALGVLRMAFRVMGTLTPRLAAGAAHVLWYRPQRYAPPTREQLLLASAESRTLEIGNKRISVYAWGAGRTVLLVHGWSGRGAQLGEFVTPLVDAGYRVVTFDAPAHGRSSGRETTLLEISDVIQTIVRQVAPVHAVIAHSFGVTCTLYALRQQRFAQRVVAISAPATMDGLVSKFAEQLSLSPKSIESLREKITLRFGADAWTRFSAQFMVPHINLPGLVIHDRDDDDVPAHESVRIAAAWPDARLLLTDGLGHRRILRDPSVIAHVISFIDVAQRAASEQPTLVAD